MWRIMFSPFTIKSIVKFIFIDLENILKLEWELESHGFSMMQIELENEGLRLENLLI